MRPATLEDVEQIVARLAELERRIAPEALDVSTVAERLRLSESRVWDLIGSGELPSYTIGRSRRVDPSDLAAYLADRRRAPQRVERKRAQRVSGRSWLADLQREAYGGR